MRLLAEVNNPPSPMARASTAIASCAVAWDYFVKHLLGAEPPKEYKVAPPRQDGPREQEAEGIAVNPGEDRDPKKPEGFARVPGESRDRQRSRRLSS